MKSLHCPRTSAACLTVVLAIAACDFSVINPGPVQDVNLNATAAHRGIVNGAIRSVQGGLGDGYVGENIVHGIAPAGHTGTGGTTFEEELAVLTDEGTGDSGLYSDAQQGRFIAEEAIRRFLDPEASGVTNPGSYPLLAEAYLWAGLAHRILGENMCTTVVERDPSGAESGIPQPKLKHFEYAIQHFDNAIKVGGAAGLTNVVRAATGAKAAANLWLGKGADARRDAMTVPFDFQFTTQYTGRSGEDAYLFGTVMVLAFQSASHWGTPFHPHFLTTGDSRAAWGYDNGSLAPYPTGTTEAKRAQNHPTRQTWLGLIPLYYPLKGYAPRGGRELTYFDPQIDAQRALQLNLVTGREMALVVAETYLMEGNVAAAMQEINKVRTATPVYPANLATAMNLTLHSAEERDRVRYELPTYFTGTPGDFSAGGNMPPVTATTLEQAWAALKFERLLETNLEMRRFGDRWRWRQNKTPGELHPLEYLPAQTVAKMAGAKADPLNLCFPLPRQENSANPNIPEDFRDWVSP